MLQCRIEEEDALFKTFLKGICMGAADVVPGVSGGTIALLLGIYERFIGALSKLSPASLLRIVRAERRREALRDEAERCDWLFLTVLALGILTAIALGSHAITAATEHYPRVVGAFFFVLVLCSVWAPYRGMGEAKPYHGLLVVLFMLGSYFLMGAEAAPMTEEGAFGLRIPAAAFILYGFIAITAMMLPGISGSFLLLILGAYYPILESVKRISSAAAAGHDIASVMCFAFGALFGLAFFSRLLKWMLREFPGFTMSAIIGIMLGGLRVLWPYKDGGENVLPQLEIDVISGALAAPIVVFSLNFLSRRER